MVVGNFYFIYSTWQWSMHTSCITKHARKKKCRLKFSTKKSPKDCSLLVQSQTSSPAGRLVRSDLFVYTCRIPATQAKLEGKAYSSCRVSAERSKRQAGKTAKKCTTMYCRKCDVGLWIDQCFEVLHTKLTGSKSDN